MVRNDKDWMQENLLKAKHFIIKGLDNSFNEPEIYKKYYWLKEKYNTLIIFDKETKTPIRELNEGISGNNIHYSYTEDFYEKHKKLYG